MSGGGEAQKGVRPDWPPIVALGIGAGCISALQPLLLDLLRQAGNLDVGTMGLAATAEAAGMAVATTLAAIWLPLRHLRRIALAALLAMIVANAGTTLASGAGIVALRLLSGLGSGILLWILVGMLSRSAAPGRIFAIYVTAQSVLALALSQAMTGLVVPLLGYRGSYGMLVAMNLLLLAALPRMVDGYADMGSGGRRLPGLRATFTLLAMTSFLAGIMSLWVYLMPTLAEAGYAADKAQLALTLGIGSQIAGGLLATVLAPRLPAFTAWMLGCLGAMLAVAMLIGGLSAPVMLTGAALFGFVWIFVPPFHMPAVLGVDPSGRGALLVGTAQLSGTVIGPLTAAPLVARYGVPAAWQASLGWMALSLLLLVLLQIGGRARAAHN